MSEIKTVKQLIQVTGSFDMQSIGGTPVVCMCGAEIEARKAHVKVMTRRGISIDPEASTGENFEFFCPNCTKIVSEAIQNEETRLYKRFMVWNLGAVMQILGEEQANVDAFQTFAMSLVSPETGKKQGISEAEIAEIVSAKGVAGLLDHVKLGKSSLTAFFKVVDLFRETERAQRAVYENGGKAIIEACNVARNSGNQDAKQDFVALQQLEGWGYYVEKMTAYLETQRRAGDQEPIVVDSLFLPRLYVLPCKAYSFMQGRFILGAERQLLQLARIVWTEKTAWLTEKGYLDKVQTFEQYSVNFVKPLLTTVYWAGVNSAAATKAAEEEKTRSGVTMKSLLASLGEDTTEAPAEDRRREVKASPHGRNGYAKDEKSGGWTPKADRKGRKGRKDQDVDDDGDTQCAARAGFEPLDA